MEFKGMPFLLPIKPYLAVFNTIITVFLNAAPLFSFIKISRGQEEYTNIPFLMLVVNIGNNIIWGCYWIRQQEYISFLSSFISGFFSTAYIFWYNYFASKKVISKFFLYSLVHIFIELGVVYLFLSSIFSLKTVGLILIVIATLQYIAPAQKLYQAIKTKDQKLIPIVSTIVGCLCSGGWTLFGLIIGDLNCILPNGLGLVSSILTTIAYFWIKSVVKDEKEDDEEMGETLNDEEK